MKIDWQNRYHMRQEDNGTWTVFDTTATSGRENRIMIGLTEVRAQAYVDRLNGRTSYSSREKDENGELEGFFET